MSRGLTFGISTLFWAAVVVSAGARADVKPPLAKCPPGIKAGPEVLAPPAVAGVSSASKVAAQYPATQDEMIAKMMQQGFKCEPPRPEGGFTCYGKVDGYPSDVAILVPKNYQPTKDAQLVLHLHGRHKPTTGLKKLVDDYEFQKQLNASGKNALMVMPYGKTENDLPDNLGKAAQFDAFMAGVTKVTKGAELTKTAEVGKITLTTHSMGARAATRLLEQANAQQDLLAKDPYAPAGAASKIHEVYAVDSIYSYEQGYPFMKGYDSMTAYNQFARRSTNRFWASYITETAKDCAPEIQKRMCAPGAKQSGGPKNPLPGGNCADAGAPKFKTVPYDPKAPLKPAALAGDRVGFINGSWLNHETSVNTLWGTMLASGSP